MCDHCCNITRVLDTDLPHVVTLPRPLGRAGLHGGHRCEAARLVMTSSTPDCRDLHDHQQQWRPELLQLLPLLRAGLPVPGDRVLLHPDPRHLPARAPPRRDSRARAKAVCPGPPAHPLLLQPPRPRDGPGGDSSVQHTG